MKDSKLKDTIQGIIAVILLIALLAGAGYVIKHNEQIEQQQLEEQVVSDEESQR